MKLVVDKSFSMVTDPITLLLAIILCIIISRTYLKNKKGIWILIGIIGFVILGCITNITIDIILNGEKVSYNTIRLLKNFYFICSIISMYLYVMYINYVSNYNTFKNTRVLYLDFLVTVISILLQCITSDNKDLDIILVPFILSYIVGMSSIFYMLIVKRTEIALYFRNLLVLSNLVSIIIVIYNIMRYRTSYISFTFLIPILFILFFKYTNPYEYDTGALNYESFDIYLKENKGKRLYFAYLKVYVDKDDIPKEITKAIMKFYYSTFKKAKLFSLTNTSYVLVIPEEVNNYPSQIIDTSYKIFKEAYDKFRIGFNLQYIDYTDVFESLYEFKFVTKRFLKKQSLNKYNIYDNKQVLDAKKSLIILEVLKDIDKCKNFNDKRVIVYCQPVKNIKTGKYDTAEALMRLNIEEIGGIVTPDKFIELAEQENLIHSLSMIILNKTCKAIYEMREQGYCINRISVNFSQIELRHKNFVSDVIDIIDTIGIPHDTLAIEVTENVNDTDYVIMTQRIKQLKEENIYFYLDDFGTGYNNFDRMLGLKLNILKFDRSLLLFALKEDNQSFILGHFAEMFKKLGYEVLFEGVENEEQEKFCIESHADYIQGYYYSKPIPIEDLVIFLDKAT